MSLNDLEHLLLQLDGFPLLPCGAGVEGKAPVDPETGGCLKGWESKRFTPEQILSFNGFVTAVGTRTGPEAGFLLILDIDGKSAVERCMEAAAYPKAAGWTIRRNTDRYRLKVAFYIPPELAHLVTDANGEPIGKRVLQTAPAVYDLDADNNPKRDEHGHLITLKKQEAIELFYGTGQCLVLGAHKPSGGKYVWDGSPISIAPPTDAWLAVIKDVLAAQAAEAKALHPKGSGSTKQSSPARPCVICGRNTSPACTTYSDGERVRLNCYEGQTFNPRDAHGALKEGQTITGVDGITYAYCGQFFNPSIGSFSKFVQHLERTPEPVAQPSGAAQGDLDDELDEDDLALQREALERYIKAQDAQIDLCEVLGPFWGQLLIDRAAAFPCDPNMLLLPMLSFMASIIGTRASVRVKGGWQEPLIIYGLIAQAASSLKSPVAGVFLRVLAKLQSAAAQDYAKQHGIFKQKESRWKAECARIKKAADKSDSSPDLPDPPEPPTPPRHYYVETVTIERLAEIHSQSNVPGLLAFHDELSDWFASLDKRNGQTDRPKWLKLWTGQAIKHDTRTSLSAFAERTAVSVCGFIQPDKLAALHAAEYDADFDTSGDGLWARFLPIIPKALPFTFNDLEVDITDDVTRLAQLLDELPRNTVLSIHPAAIRDVLKPAWEEWSRMEAQTSPSRQAFIGKLRGYSVRLAGLLHLVNEQQDLTIATPTAITAVNLCKFFLAQFDLLAPQVTNKEDVSSPIARFLAKVRDKGASEVSAREAQQWKVLGRKAKAKDYRAFLQQLDRQGIGKCVQVSCQGSKAGSWVWQPTLDDV